MGHGCRELNPSRQTGFAVDPEGHCTGPTIFNQKGIPQQFAFRRFDRELALRELSSGNRIEVWPITVPSSATISANGSTVIAGTEEGKVFVFRRGVKNPVYRLSVETRTANPGVFAVAISPDGTLFATASGDPATVKVWNVNTRRQIAQFTHSNSAKGIAFSPDGRIWP